MKKTLALLLALLTVGASFAACGGNAPDVTTSGTETTTASAAPVVTEETPDLPDPASVNIAGEFNILVSGNYARNDFASDSMDGTAVEQAIYRRNQVMKETWGVDVKNEDITRFGSAGGTGDGYMKIYTDYMAGDQVYDAAMIGTYDVATLAYSGYIHDLCDIPHIDLTKSWWNQKANKDLSIRGRMFYTTGDISVVDNMVTHALLFNKDMVKSYGLDNPYDLVADDNWNLETFGALVKQVGQDLDNNGVYDENDLYGLLTWNDPMTAILAAAGEKIASINDRGELTLTLYNERVINLYDTFEGIVFDQAHAFNYQFDNTTGKGSPSKVWNTNRDTIFNTNRALFYLNTVTTAERHRDSELDFGILPYPKLNREQKEYGHNVSAFHCQFLCVPEIAKNYDRSGIVLEALAYEGKKLLTPAYYDQTLVGKSVRDEESVAMLDIIFATRVFDVGIYYNIGTYKNELGKLFTTRSSIATIYETYRSNAEATITAINETFSKSIGE